jgi:23S rRNA (uracil1939-C5)-methyltransferase
MNNQFELKLTNTVYGGDCIGRLPDGRSIFVPFSIPGEIIKVELQEEKKGFTRGSILEIIEVSPERIVPRCPHYMACGGCHYQHVNYAKQLEWKSAILADQLKRIGGIQFPPLKPIVPSPQEWNYRNTVQFHLDPQGKLGFQTANSHQVIKIDECHLPEKALCDFFPQVEFEPLASIERVELRLGEGEEIMLTIKGDEQNIPEIVLDAPVSVVHLGKQSTVVLAGENTVQMQVFERQFSVSAGSFFQVNTQQAEKMVDLVKNLLSPSKEDVLFDIYCGVGLFSAFLAPLTKNVIGIELSPFACEDFAYNLNEFDNIELYEGKAEHILPQLSRKADLVVIDPPRSGIDPKALMSIINMHPRKIVYISCDPATLARDAQKLLSSGFQMESCTPFDLFPQTFHIESITLFQKY